MGHAQNGSHIPNYDTIVGEMKRCQKHRLKLKIIDKLACGETMGTIPTVRRRRKQPLLRPRGGPSPAPCGTRLSLRRISRKR